MQLKTIIIAPRLVSNPGLFPDATAPLLTLCEQNHTGCGWEGPGSPAPEAGGSSAASALDGVTWKLCPGRRGPLQSRLTAG